MTRLVHTVKYQFEMPLEDRVSEKNIFRSTLIGKRERKKNHFPHFPFELPVNQHI